MVATSPARITAHQSDSQPEPSHRPKAAPSPARIAASQANGRKGRGPTSPEGKSRSRLNAITHGFCAEVLAVEDPDLVRARADELALMTQAVEVMDEWAAGQVALLSVRIERCQEEEEAIRDRIVARAEVTWDEDRRLEATLLGATLGKRPEAISARLLETYHGCDWLIVRWSMLANSAMTQGCWTTEQSKLAFDLLGTPLEFREGSWPGASIDAKGKIVNPSDDELSIARRQIAALIERKERLRPLDEAARERAKADLAPDTDPEMRKLRRYETALQRRLEWSFNLFQSASPSTQAPPEPTPEPESPTEPDPTDDPDLLAPKATPTDPSPAWFPSRAEKRLIKAELRREAKQRKLDNRRA